VYAAVQTLSSLLIAWLWLSVPALARSIDAPAIDSDATASRKCEAVLALEGLSLAERTALAARCRGGTEPVPEKVVRSAATSGWRLDLTGRLLHGEPSAVDAESQWLADAAAKLGRCSTLRDAIAALATDGGPEPTALVPGSDTCALGMPPGSAALLVVLGPPTLTRVRAVDSLDARPRHSVAIPHAGQGFSAWMLLIPANREHVVVAEASDWDVPFFFERQTRAPEDASKPLGRVVDLREVRTGCLRLEIASPFDTMVLVDGHEIDPRKTVGDTLVVPVLDNAGARMHPQRLSVLTVGSSIAGPVHHDFADGDFAGRLTCETVTYDLRPPTAVTLLDVPATSACSVAGANRESVWQTAKMYLDDAGDFRDFRGTATLLRWMREIESDLAGERDSTVGASRGPYELGAAGRRAATDLWRQGVSRVFGVTLECSETPGSPVTLVAWVWDLDKLTGFDRVRGLAQPDALESTSEVVIDGRDLERATRRALARLLRREYLAIVAPIAPIRLHEPLDVTVEVRGLVEHAGDDAELLRTGRVRLDAWELAPESASRVCTQLASTGRVRGDEFAVERLGRRLAVGPPRKSRRKGSQPATNGASNVALLGFRVWPRHSGWVLVQARYFEREATEGSHDPDAGLYGRIALRPRDERVAKDRVYACVEVEGSGWVAWTEAGYAVATKNFHEDLSTATGGAASRTVRVRLGVDRVLSLGASGVGLTVGPVLGYTNRFRTYRRTPSWDDLGAGQDGPVRDDDGDDPPRWTRHGVLGGIKLGITPTGCNRRQRDPQWACSRGRHVVFGWFDWAGALDVGVVDLSGVPDELVTFRAGEHDDILVDADFDMELSTGVGAMISRRMWFAGTLGLALFALDDLAVRAEELPVVTQDAGLAVLIGVRLGVSP
jgi:hypothetical protein